MMLEIFSNVKNIALMLLTLLLLASSVGCYLAVENAGGLSEQVEALNNELLLRDKEIVAYRKQLDDSNNTLKEVFKAQEVVAEKYKTFSNSLNKYKCGSKTLDVNNSSKGLPSDMDVVNILNNIAGVLKQSACTANNDCKPSDSSSSAMQDDTNR